MNQLKKFISRHKIWSIIILIGILVIGWLSWQAKNSANGATRYVVSTVSRGALVSAITGSGQIAASNQIDLKSKVSGNIVYVGATDGQQVQAGELLAEIDPTSAEADLTSAKLALAKLEEPPDSVTLTQAKNNIVKDYDDGFNNVTNLFVTLNDVMNNLSNQLFSNSGYLSQNNNYNDSTVQADLDKARQSYGAAKNKFDELSAEYKATPRSSPFSSIDTLISNAYIASQEIAQAVKDAKTAADYMAHQNLGSATTAASAQSSLNAWASSASMVVNDLLASKNSIAADTQALSKLEAGTDPLDLQTQELAIKQKELALANYYIRAPIAGIVGKMDVKLADPIDAGTVVATILTPEQQAVISLNEVDAAKVKIGQPATLTFDAIDGLSLTGKVTNIDLIGTVSQGVVSYNVTITLDLGDPRVKAGMSVNASIVIAAKQDVLLVPNSALKTQGDQSYVEVPAAPLSASELAAGSNQGVTLSAVPVAQAVETGLTNDAETEITAGLKEGDRVITRTISGTNPSSPQAPSLLGGGVSRAGGGANTGAAARIIGH